MTNPILEVEFSTVEVCILAGFVARNISPDSVEADEFLKELMAKCQRINFAVAEFKMDPTQDNPYVQIIIKEQ